MSGLSAAEGSPEVGVGGEGVLDVLEEGGADDAPTAPHQRNPAVVQRPLELIRRRA